MIESKISALIELMNSYGIVEMVRTGVTALEKRGQRHNKIRRLMELPILNCSTGVAMSNKTIEIFDSTLRDGAQGENIAFSLEDKIKVALALDKIRVTFIEAGNPGSNPKDMEFFKRMRGNKIN